MNTQSKLQKELDNISRWLKGTTPAYIDWNWDGKELTVVINEHANEKYTSDDLKQLNIIR